MRRKEQTYTSIKGKGHGSAGTGDGTDLSPDLEVSEWQSGKSR